MWVDGREDSPVVSLCPWVADWLTINFPMIDVEQQSERHSATPPTHLVLCHFVGTTDRLFTRGRDGGDRKRVCVL